MEAIWGMLVNWVLTWPTWRLIRAFGLTAYVFLFIAVFSALVARFPFLEGRKKSAWLSPLEKVSFAVLSDLCAWLGSRVVGGYGYTSSLGCPAVWDNGRDDRAVALSACNA